MKINERSDFVSIPPRFNKHCRGRGRTLELEGEEKDSRCQLQDKKTFAITNLQQLQVLVLGVQKNGPVRSRYGWRWGSEGILLTVKLFVTGRFKEKGSYYLQFHIH